MRSTVDWVLLAILAAQSSSAGSNSRGVDHSILTKADAPPGVQPFNEFPFKDNCRYSAEGVVCKVPPGHYFMMGDHRDDSQDSRYWGFVPRENIVGRPMFVYWSFQTPADQINKQTIGDRISFIGHIIVHIFDETRWSRTLHRVE